MRKANTRKGPRKALPARENRNLCSIIGFEYYMGRPTESSGNLRILRNFCKLAGLHPTRGNRSYRPARTVPCPSMRANRRAAPLSPMAQPRISCLLPVYRKPCLYYEVRRRLEATPRAHGEVTVTLPTNQASLFHLVRQ